MTLSTYSKPSIARPITLAFSLFTTLTAVLTLSAQLHATEVPESEQTEEDVHSTDTRPANETASLPTAENINLSEPVVEPKPAPTNSEIAQPAHTDDKGETPTSDEAATKANSGQPAEKVKAKPKTAPPTFTRKPVYSGAETSSGETLSNQGEDDSWVFLDTLIMKGSTTRLSWSPDQSFEGIETPTPVLIAHGAKPGPKLCLTAALHGDELNGIEIVRRVLYNIDAKELAGTVIGVPIVNLQGFHRSSRYLTDRRDLNRFFPGNPTGSSASRIAHSFFQRVISHCDLLVDLHTGSFYRTNLPQLRANLRSPDVVALTKNFDAIVVLHSEGAKGTLRRSAVDAGIPAVTLEAGGPMELNEEYVEQGVKAINTLLDKNGMLTTISFWGTPQPTFYRSQWVRTDHGGILFSDVKLGGKVRKGDLLGVVTDPITNFREEILSPVTGRIIGMAVNQVVLPGFAAYHIGITPSTVNQYNETNPPPTSDEIHEEDARID